jgi:hypothetical protein
MSRQMDHCSDESQLEGEVILKRIIADFEQLDHAIDAAIALLNSGAGSAEEIETLRRARKAAQRGAALARTSLGSA